MSTSENWGTRLFLIFASISLPVCVFYPSSPNVTFRPWACVVSVSYSFAKNSRTWFRPCMLYVLFLYLTTWALIACLWSSTPETSLLNVGKIALAVLGAVSFYAAGLSLLTSNSRAGTSLDIMSPCSYSSSTRFSTPMSCGPFAASPWIHLNTTME